MQCARLWSQLEFFIFYYYFLIWGGEPNVSMAEGREAVDLIGESAKVQRPLHFKSDYFMKKAMDSRRKFGLDGNGNPNYGREAVGFFSLNNQSSTRSWPLDWRGYFEQGIKWHAL
jgi:hypothetical protein